MIALLAMMAVSACVGQRYDIVKAGVSAEEERTDWGLCGGDFNANGDPEIGSEKRDVIFNCMKEKEYEIRKH